MTIRDRYKPAFLPPGTQLPPVHLLNCDITITPYGKTLLDSLERSGVPEYLPSDDAQPARIGRGAP